MKAGLQSLRRFLLKMAGVGARRHVCLGVFLFLCAGARGESLTLKRAVELALAHSPLAVEASADEQHAFAAMREAHDQYIPQVTAGSGLGDSWGYPLSLEGSA